MRSVIRVLTIGLIVVTTAVAMAQAPALDAEVESALGAAAWTDTTAAHVRLQRTPWRGPDDLSLRYRLTAHEGVFYLQARVRDDRPCFGEGAALVSDHLEVWLADPAVVKEIDALRGAVDDLNADMETGGEADSFSRKVSASLSATRRALRRPLGLTQLRLHPGACAADPEPVPGAVRHLFRPEAGGYSVWLRVELAGAISRGGLELGGLLYLVDALDVDDPAATVQEKLVSSSTSRRWADAATFWEMAFGTPVRLPMTDETARMARLVPGYLCLTGGSLQWVTRGEDPQSGSYGIERMLLPAPYVPPVVTRLVDEPDWHLWLYETRLLAGPGEGVVTDLDERIGAAAARRLLAESAVIRDEAKAIDGLVEHFLLSYGEGNFVRNLRAQFSAVRFFSCSSTGRMIRPGDYSSLQPARVLEPLLWLMAQNNVLPMTRTEPAPVAVDEARPYPDAQAAS